VTTFATYQGSNGDATKALYGRLEALGPVGTIALNLFRAAKCSERAKEYSRRFKGEAYGRKQWSLGNLDAALTQHAQALGITWGWKRDPAQALHCWVLYVDIPTGQVSFHTAARSSQKEYAGEWSGLGGGPFRIVNWCDRLLGEPESAPVTTMPLRVSSPAFVQQSLL
jgi:hypothetical protein